MSLRQGSIKTPLAAGIVFCVGLGIGAAWKLGWIPLEYHAAPSGTIEESDFANSDDSLLNAVAPPPEEEAEDRVPVWAVEQSEPPIQVGENLRAERAAKSQALWEAGRSDSAPVRAANYEAEPDEAETPEESPAPIEEGQVEESETAALPIDRFAEIDAKLEQGEVLAAHKALSKMYWNSSGRDPELQERLDTTAKKIFFSPQPHFIEPYVVQPGDQLRKVARKYNLSWEYLAALNRTDPKRIRAGQKLKVLKGLFSAIVSLHDFSLTVHLQGYYVKRYAVGVGKDGSSPIGKFPVLDKIENPQYTDPDGKVFEGDDPNNPLGKRWIDLGDSYGIHGTIDPNSIGKAESRGCIRLRDADIIEVYNFLVRDSIVEIRE